MVIVESVRLKLDGPWTWQFRSQRGSLTKILKLTGIVPIGTDKLAGRPATHVVVSIGAVMFTNPFQPDAIL